MSALPVVPSIPLYVNTKSDVVTLPSDSVFSIATLTISLLDEVAEIVLVPPTADVAITWRVDTAKPVLKSEDGLNIIGMIANGPLSISWLKKG